MARIKLDGVTTDDNGDVFADSDSALGQVAARAQGAGRGPGMNLLQAAAGGFSVITNLINEGTADLLKNDLARKQGLIDAQRVQYDKQLGFMDTLGYPTELMVALKQQSAINRLQADAMTASVQLAELERTDAIEDAVSSGLNLAGGLSGGGGGSGYFQFDAAGNLVPVAVAALGGFAVGRLTGRRDPAPVAVSTTQLVLASGG